MTRTRGLLAAALACAALSFAPGARAVVLTLTSSSSIVTAGDTVTLSVAASGLGSGAAPSISVFDLYLTFDPALFSPVAGAAFGSELDFGTGSLRSEDLSVPGEVLLSEISFELDPDVVDANQPDAVGLVMMDFVALGPSLATSFDLRLTGPNPSRLGDAIGDPLDIDSVNPVTLVIQPRVTVPAPGPLALLALGLAALGARRPHRGRCPTVRDSR